MALPPAGRGRRVPGRSRPAKNLGNQSFLWPIDGPDSEGDWNARERWARRATRRTLAACVLLVWGVMGVRLVALLPNVVLWWALAAGFTYRGLKWLLRYAGEQPARKEARAVIAVVTLMTLLLVSRFAANECVAWLVAAPAALLVASALAKNIATGFALWTTCVRCESPSERRLARRQWWAAAGTPEIDTIKRGRMILALAYAAAVATWLLTTDGLLPWLAFVAVAVGGWCVLCTCGRAPHQVAAVTWRAIVLWCSYNRPLPDGETRLEPYTYQMPDPWVLLYDRAMSIRFGVIALAVAVVAVFAASTWHLSNPGEHGVRIVGDIIVNLACYLGVVTAIPFMLFFAVLFTVYGTALTDYYARFAAVAVAEAKRRSST